MTENRAIWSIPLPYAAVTLFFVKLFNSGTSIHSPEIELISNDSFLEIKSILFSAITSLNLVLLYHFPNLVLKSISLV